MRRGFLLVGMLTIMAGVAVLCTLGRVWAADAPAAVDYTKISPVDLVKQTPKGKLSNPYKDTQADIVAQGGQFMLSYSCSGCHGGGETERASKKQQTIMTAIVRSIPTIILAMARLTCF